MVKGVTKRVVVVRCPDTKYFDQAIFMVRDDKLEGRSPDQLLAEACRVADSYIRNNVEKRRRFAPWLIGGTAAILLAAVLLVIWM